MAVFNTDSIPRKVFIFLIAALAWLAVVVQFFLMIENRTASVLESIVRFFSFFTILTNSLVALYFTSRITGNSKLNSLFNKEGALTAITVYIFIVGAVYQFILRQTWEPQGLQLIVDELLHTVIPVLVVLFWWKNEENANHFRFIPYFLIYPLVYITIILVRGYFSGFYPYPFIHVDKLGLFPVLINCLILFAVFIIVSALFIGLNRKNTK